MMDIFISTGRLVAAIVLVVLNGFFVASEFAYVRVRSSAVDQLVADGRPGATMLREALSDLDDYLAVTQLGITIASLGLGWLGEPAVANLLEPLLEDVLPSGALHLVSFILAFSFITFLHVVFGELAPKTIAIAQAERIALLVSPPMKMFYYIFMPGIIVFNGTANWVTRRIGIPPASETDEIFTEAELRHVLGQSGQAGRIDVGEVEMIDRIFELDDLQAREVMVPRPDVVTVESDRSLDDVRERIAEADHTRYPVIDHETPEHVVGLLDVKDVLRAVADDATATAEELARPIGIAPETASLIDLLEEMQSSNRQVTAIIDEWGGFAGLVTVEDIIEAVVGDIQDQFDVGEPSIRAVGDERYHVDASVSIDQVNEQVGTSLESSVVTTVGGFVLDRLGHVPSSGDTIVVGDYELEVLAVENRRIESIEIRPVADEQ